MSNYYELTEDETDLKLIVVRKKLMDVGKEFIKKHKENITFSVGVGKMIIKRGTSDTIDGYDIMVLPKYFTNGDLALQVEDNLPIGDNGFGFFEIHIKDKDIKIYLIA